MAPAVKHAEKPDTTIKARSAESAGAASALQYQAGFGNQFLSEAVAGALPVGRNSPQRPPLGLYAEQISGTRHYTTVRALKIAALGPTAFSRRWCIGPHARISNRLIRSASLQAKPKRRRHQLRWSPFPIPRKVEPISSKAS